MPAYLQIWILFAFLLDTVSTLGILDYFSLEVDVIDIFCNFAQHSYANDRRLEVDRTNTFETSMYCRDLRLIFWSLTLHQ